MAAQAILLPLFVEVILTFALLFWLAPLRARNFATGAVRREDIALREQKWPQQTLQVGNSFSNQFELPVLFYVLTILAFVTRLAGILFVMLAWIFVLFRLLHAFVHVTSNNVQRRGVLFIVSAVVLAVMWIGYMVQVLTLPRPV